MIFNSVSKDFLLSFILKDFETTRRDPRLNVGPGGVEAPCDPTVTQPTRDPTERRRPELKLSVTSAEPRPNSARSDDQSPARVRPRASLPRRNQSKLGSFGVSRLRLTLDEVGLDSRAPLSPASRRFPLGGTHIRRPISRCSRRLLSTGRCFSRGEPTLCRDPLSWWGPPHPQPVSQPAALRQSSVLNISN